MIMILVVFSVDSESWREMFTGAFLPLFNDLGLTVPFYVGFNADDCFILAFLSFQLSAEATLDLFLAVFFADTNFLNL